MKQSTDELVREYLTDAHSIAFEGCHKVYIMMSPEGTDRMRQIGYGDGTDESQLLLVSDLGIDKALDTLREWFVESCGLKFVQAVSGTGDRNEDFTDVISQARWTPCDWEDWDEEDEL